MSKVDPTSWYTLDHGFTDCGGPCADLLDPEGNCIASELPTGSATTIVEHLNNLLTLLRSDHDHSHR